MHASLLKCYHALPATLRGFAATLRGYHLMRWRYGAEGQQVELAECGPA